MASSDFPKMFKCPKCGSDQTTIGKALAPLKMNGTVSLAAFGSMDKKYTPLVEPKDCKLFIPILVTHFDVCFECGTYYVTKVEIMQAPKQQQPIMNNMGKN